ncbi:MAG TPA: AbrB family transcriptional regulator [Aldersonia sp.]
MKTPTSDTRRTAARWLLLVAATAAVWSLLTVAGAPSAALFASLLVAIGLALAGRAPTKVPKWSVSIAQAALGVVIGTMVHLDTLRALGDSWLPVLAVCLGTLLVSIVAGALLALHRDVDPITGSLSLIAGGASGLVAIARDLGGDERMVAVVQYLRVAVVVVTLPLIAVFAFGADPNGGAATASAAGSPWYLGVAFLVGVAAVGLLIARFVPIPAGSLLVPLTIATVLELTGLDFGATVPHAVLPLALIIVGWQAGLAFDRESVAAIGRALPWALVLIVGIGVACAGLGVLLARLTGTSSLEGYLATTPGGLSAVLALSASSGANPTFVAGVQLLRLIMMLFLAPVLSRLFVLIGRRMAQRAAARKPELATSSR